MTIIELSLVILATAVIAVAFFTAGVTLFYVVQKYRAHKFVLSNIKDIVRKDGADVLQERFRQAWEDSEDGTRN